MNKQKIKLNKEKLKQVLHYIISESGSLDNVGKTVLFKMLYFSDFDYYELNETSITGETYVKLPMGPAPSSFSRIVQELKTEGKIKEIRATFGGLSQIKFLSLCKPGLNLINAEELEVIKNVIKKLSGMTGRQVSAYSHEDIPWKSTDDGESIDYKLVFYRSPAFSVIENNLVC